MINNLQKLTGLPAGRQGLPGGRQGFTLIETLVAVLILATSIVGPLTIASKGLSSALVAKDQTIADFLAQDAVEYVRWARDTNGLNGDDWLQGGSIAATNLGLCVSSDGTHYCNLDSLNQSPQAPTACFSQTCDPLNYNTSAHEYTYAAADGVTVVPTLYTRSVALQTPVCKSAGVNCNYDEAALVVTVSWSDLPGATHQIVVRENLLNWQRNQTP